MKNFIENITSKIVEFAIYFAIIAIMMYGMKVVAGFIML